MEPNVATPLLLTAGAIALYVYIIRRCGTGLMGFTLFAVFSIGSTGLTGFLMAKILGLSLDWVSQAHVAVFNYTALGLISMGAGILIAWRPLSKSSQQSGTPQPAWLNPKFIYFCVLVGTVSYLLRPLVFRVPTVTSLWSTLTPFLRMGVLSALLYGLVKDDMSHFYFSLIPFIGITSVSIVSSGHVGGLTSFILQASVILLFYRGVNWRKLLLIIPFLVLFVGLYVGWMEQRSIIREGELEGSGQIEAVSEFFEGYVSSVNILNMEAEYIHQTVMRRLDGSSLLAEQVRFQPKKEPYAYGETIVSNVLISLVPRIIWPEKPLQAGGHEFVSRFTGKYFTEETNVGLPWQFELYANGGSVLVVIGLFFVGWAIARIELEIFRKKISMNKVLIFMVCLFVVSSAGGRFYRIIKTIIAGCIGAYILSVCVRFYFPGYARRLLKR